MQKIFMLNMGGHGHVNPTLALTQELVARGHEVHYAVPGPFGATVAATGALVHDYDSLWMNTQPATGKDLAAAFAELPLRFIKEVLHAMPQLVPLVQSLKPDVILYDSMALTGHFIAEALSLPCISLHTTYVSNEKFSLLDAFGLGEPTPEVANEFAELMRQLQASYPVKAILPGQVFSGKEDRNLVFLPRSFQIAGDSFDDHYIFCGPQITPRPTAGSWHPQPGRQRPLVYISLGTVFSNWPEFFQMCYAAFGGLPVDVVLATSTRVDSAQLGQAPANFTTSTHVPQLEVLPWVDVFISHGGMNSTMEALYFGVPLVVIPQMPEQAVSARQIAELGLGKAFLQRADVTPAALAAAAMEVMQDKVLKAKLQHMQQMLKQAGGAPLAADSVEAYLRTHPVTPAGAQTQPDSLSR